MTSTPPVCADPATRPTVARVAVPKPLRRLFDYAMPDGATVVPGTRVRVPFGRESLIGVVAEVGGTSEHRDLKTLTALDHTAVVPDDVDALIRWAADYYHHPLGDAYATALPAEVRSGRTARATEVARWQLTASADAALLGRAPRQRHALEWLRARDAPASAMELGAAGIKGGVIKALRDRGFIEPAPPPPPAAGTPSRLELGNDQAHAVAAVTAASEEFGVFLLDGVTGSGKTEVYMRVMAEVLERGRQVLVLVPEIALTPQTVARFRHRFGAAAMLHSGLTDRERYDVWYRCREGAVPLVIGTRSAIFTPLPDLGLIVVDEEHDASYKQHDGFHYNARDLAVVRGRHRGIPVLLGSATPSLETLHNVSGGRYRHLVLSERAGGAVLPRPRLVDIRGLRLTDGLSEPLMRTIEVHLGAGNQVLVFINRRGFAPTCLCTRCGWCAECPRCDVRLTLHRAPPHLRCHHCDHREGVPEACPACAKDALIPVGSGTQRTEEGLARAFPDVPVIRIDRDTARSRVRLAAHLQRIRSGERALLVGTQLLAKGHHFPNVTLVAVLNADAGFFSADFRAPERTAQLIVQVAGRAGRAERPGEVCIQTNNPDNALLASLVDDGYAGFAAGELDRRRSAALPPFRPIALLRAESAAQTDGLEWQRAVLEAVEPVAGVEVLGPVPAPMARRGGRYRCQTLVIGNNRAALHRLLAALLEAAEAHGRRGVRWALDVDPYDTF